MTNSVLQNKGFRNSDDDDLARTTKILIAKIHKHIRDTNCKHCKNILQNE